MKRIFIQLILMSMLPSFHPVPPRPISIKWKRIAVLPTLPSNDMAGGVAGAIHGVSNNVLIVAGGSNFPLQPPWLGGKKNYYNKIDVLQQKDDEFEWNPKVRAVLPEPIAYCGITSTPSGIVYAGGENDNGISDSCFQLTWNARRQAVIVKNLPALPLALTNVSLTHVGDVVYAVGGDEASSTSRRFFSLDVSHRQTQWKRLPDLPVALANATVIAQWGPSGIAIYVIGGRTKTPSGISQLHGSTFAFDLGKKQWRRCAAINDGIHFCNLSAASGVALGQDEIIITGGDNGRVFHRIETLLHEISHSQSAEVKEKLVREKNDLYIHHQGFDKSLLLYNTKTDSWSKIGDLPFPAHVTTTDVKWNNGIVVSNGEIRPGIRTPDVMFGKVLTNKEKHSVNVTQGTTLQ